MEKIDPVLLAWQEHLAFCERGIILATDEIARRTGESVLRISNLEIEQSGDRAV